MKHAFSPLSRWTACLLALCLCVAPLTAARAASPADEASRLAGGILDCRLAAAGVPDVQAWLDGPLADAMGIGGEWYALALSQRGSYDLTQCRLAMLRCIGDNAVPSASTRLKHALVLAATGSTDSVVAATLAEAAGQQGIMSHVFALHLLNNGVTAPGVTTADTLELLLSLQCADGGWALQGTVSDPDVTAMTLQALAPHREDEAVRAAIDRALLRLSGLQRSEGDYASYGTPNPETTAQVLIALSALGIDAMTDARFIQDGCTLLDGLRRYCLPDGSFSHRLGDASSDSATMQAFLALTAYERFCAGRPGLYLLDHAGGTFSPDTYPLSQYIPHFGYKVIAAGVIVLLALLAMLLLLVLQKRHRRNFLAVLLIAAALIALVLLTDFQSADSYYTGALPDKPDPIGTVTLTIRCDAAIVQAAAAHLPADGVILPATELPIAPGDTVFTVLTEAAQAFGIHLESSGSAGMRYLRGIANLYEFSCGDLSGWMYVVNGTAPSVGCDQYALTDGDAILWAYSLDMGGDLGLR